ncbi:MAG: SIS domain-containing protein [Verrucomicrobiae bacterium]
MAPQTKLMGFFERVRQFAALVESSTYTKQDGSVLGIEDGMAAACEMILLARNQGSAVFVIGNGGSAAIASHAVIDLINVAKIRAFTLHEPSVMTGLTNDYGYENAYSRMLDQMSKPGDVLVAISSSGRSLNICKAADQMLNNGGKVMTLSGFSHDNPLRAQGDLNIWLDACDYGLVEVGHQFILHNLSDRFGAGYLLSEQ